MSFIVGAGKLDFQCNKTQYVFQDSKETSFFLHSGMASFCPEFDLSAAVVRVDQKRSSLTAQFMLFKVVGFFSPLVGG